MIIKTGDGERIKTVRADEAPHWNDFHKRFYVWGFRFIRTRQQFSKSSTLHNFTSFEIAEE